MIGKNLLIGMFVIAFFMYLVVLGANKTKTAKEKEMEEKEQIKQLKKNYNCRRKKKW